MIIGAGSYTSWLDWTDEDHFISLKKMLLQELNMAEMKKIHLLQNRGKNILLKKMNAFPRVKQNVSGLIAEIFGAQRRSRSKTTQLTSPAGECLCSWPEKTEETELLQLKDETLVL